LFGEGESRRADWFPVSPSDISSLDIPPILVFTPNPSKGFGLANSDLSYLPVNFRPLYDCYGWILKLASELEVSNLPPEDILPIVTRDLYWAFI